MLLEPGILARVSSCCLPHCVGGAAALGVDGVDGRRLILVLKLCHALVVRCFDLQIGFTLLVILFCVVLEDRFQRGQSIVSCLLDLARRTGDGTPRHGDGHIVKRHREVEEGILHDLVALDLRVSSPIACAVIEVERTLLRGVFQASDLDAADGVLGVVDCEGHLAQHARCVAF